MAAWIASGKEIAIVSAGRTYDRQCPQIAILPLFGGEWAKAGSIKDKIAPRSLPREGPIVDDSLSIIVPVRDAQATIWDQVHYLLDLLPDLTSRFEIIVVDDASLDHTAETASDLAREYPQVRLLTHTAPRGLANAAKTGLAAARGQTILVQEDLATVSANDLRRLWSLRHDRDVVIARSQRQPGTLSPELIERLSTWGQSLRNLRKRMSPGGIQMIRRDGAQSFTLRNSTTHDRMTREAIAGAAADNSTASVAQNTPQRP